MRALWLLPVLVIGLWGADITGKWSGTIEVSDPSSGTVINTPVKAEFAQAANAVSGKIGRTEEERTEPIQNARIEGDSLVFEVRSAETTGAVKFNLKVVSDSRLEGEMKGAIEDGPISGKVKLEKVK